MNQEQPIGSDQQGLVSARRRSAARWELKSRVALTLITQIAQVCQELRAIVPKCSIKTTQLTTPSQISTSHKSRGPQLDKGGKDGKGCTRSTDNKKHVRCEDLHNSLDTQTRHEILSPPSLPPPASPSPTSSHSSSEASSSGSSTSFDARPSCSTGGNVGETMELSSFQKETKESESEEQDSRGGGLPCPNETSEWRSLNKAGIGDCQKSPKMGHWQHAEELEL